MHRSLAIEDLIKSFVVRKPQCRHVINCHLAVNSAFHWEFFGEHPDARLFGLFCCNESMPLEFLASLPLKNSNRTKLLMNEAIPQKYHEENFALIEDYPAKDDITMKFAEVFRNPQLSYEFCCRLIAEKNFPIYGLLYHRDTPPEVVKELSTDENLEHVVSGPFVTLDDADKYLRMHLANEDYFYPFEFAPVLQRLLDNPEIPNSWFEERFDEINARKLIDGFGPRFSLEFLQRLVPRMTRCQIIGALENPYITVPFAEQLSHLLSADDFYYAVAANSGLPEKFFEDHWVRISSIDYRHHAIPISLRFSGNSTFSVEFFKCHPEIIGWTIATNKFTYQLSLEQGQTDKQLITTALELLPEESSLPVLMLGVVRQEIERLEYRRWYR